MNWEAIGAIGEIIGATGVIVSVVYLAAQIRSGSRTLTTTVRDNVFASLDQWNYQLTADPEFAWMFHRGLEDFSALDEKEQSRFVHTLYGFLKLFENIYLHYRDGSVTEESWSQNSKILMAFVRTPGASEYLAQRREIFDPGFVSAVERNMETEIASPNEMKSRLAAR